MQICVIGGTGFIGGAIARAGVERGWQVRVLRRRQNAVGALGDLVDSIEWVEGTIENQAKLVGAMRDCDLVFHSAGYYTANYAPLLEHLSNARTQVRQKHVC